MVIAINKKAEMCLFNNSRYAWGMGGMGQRTNYYYYYYY